MSNSVYLPRTFDVNVYSYNILTTHHQTDKRFSKCHPQKLINRKNWIADLLERKLNNRNNVIFCLQEVSADLNEHLKHFFKARGYTMQSTSTNNGYLGEAVSFSSELFDVSGMQKHEFIEPKGFMKSRKCKRPYFLFLKLQHKQIPCTFCIGSVHLPVKYKYPVVQLIHTGNVVRHFQSFCGHNEGIIAGDFNMKPNTAAYGAVTSAMVKSDREGPEFYLQLKSKELRSAYVNCFNGEPRSTLLYKNLTLDYIFCTQKIHVINCQTIETHGDTCNNRYRYERPTVCPTAKHPSDHAIIGATLSIPVRHRWKESCENQYHKKCCRRVRRKVC